MTTRTESLAKIANQLRIHSIEATTRAGSGHPTSCCSAAELAAVIFFDRMRFDPKNPKYPGNDRFILSKGHAAPLLYAAWAEAGAFPTSELTQLRKLDSPLEGHPTPRLDFVDVATGSLGQGLSVGVGMALQSGFAHVPYNTFVLLGDGELAEGSIWEAASLAGTRKLSRLVAFLDINRWGQSQQTAFGHHIEVYQRRFEAFGWETRIVENGHDVTEIQNALSVLGNVDRPLVIIAKTIKGKGIPFAEDKPGWHGKALSREQADQVIALLKPNAISALGAPEISIQKSGPIPTASKEPKQEFRPLTYNKGDKVASRKAFGHALVRVGEVRPDVVVFDGDVENSTETQEFAKKFPERFFECYIAEQNMVSAATAFGAMGRIPFVSTFAAFFSRAMDQIRIAGISRANLKLVGTHVGVSIGEDGPSQMGIEDMASIRAISGSVVLSPCDAVSTEKLIEVMSGVHGLHYLRAIRSDTPVLYSNDERFDIGGAKILKQSPEDRVTIIATGITVFEALKAADLLQKERLAVTVIDAYSVQPLARDVILSAARKTGGLVITVEDHSVAGGLGEAVAGELSSDGVRVHRLGIREVPRSGKMDQLLARYGIDAQAIARTVRSALERDQAAKGSRKTAAA